MCPPAPLGHYDRQTDRPTNRPTNQLTQMKGHREVTLPIINENLTKVKYTQGLFFKQIQMSNQYENNSQCRIGRNRLLKPRQNNCNITCKFSDNMYINKVYFLHRNIGNFQLLILNPPCNFDKRIQRFAQILRLYNHKEPINPIIPAFLYAEYF